MWKIYHYVFTSVRISKLWDVLAQWVALGHTFRLWVQIPCLLCVCLCVCGVSKQLLNCPVVYDV